MIRSSMTLNIMKQKSKKYKKRKTLTTKKAIKLGGLIQQKT